ncbi:MAG: hypothetical protein FD137_950 [Spirochaetes bacterium]|nr:MAG: hypothetical protein FD137_950 [Spirochaetota bacterium]
MLKSMTGFAKRDFERAGFNASITLKSYNNRYLDISISLPPAFSSLEPRISAFLGSGIRRGKVECSLRAGARDAATVMKVDLELARSLHTALRSIAQACGLAEAPSLTTLAGFEGVLGREGEFDAQALWPEFEPEFVAIFEDFESSRIREGQATETNILSELGRFAAGLEVVKGSAAVMEESLVGQIKARFEEVLPKGYDEQRMLQEVAVQLVRFGINEEISRLEAHIKAFGEMLAEESPAKKLDFLCQEMNRETNTIGSKNMFIAAAHAVVDMKDSLENIREQLRNVE